MMTLTLENGAPMTVRGVFIHDALSSLFEVSVHATSERPDLALDDIVGREASFRLESLVRDAAHPNPRHWHGICARLEQLHADAAAGAIYHLRLVPAAWSLTQTEARRIYQHASVPDIVDAILERHGIRRRWQVDSAAHATFPMRTQYRESDFAFAARLLEEAGIAFRFECDDAAATMVFDDAMQRRDAREPAVPYTTTPGAADRESVHHVVIGHELRPAAVRYGDHSFHNPRFLHVARHDATPGPGGARELDVHRPGAFLVEAAPDGATPVADERGAARVSMEEGASLAQRRLEAERAGGVAIRADHNALDLGAGDVFSIADHPHPLLADSSRLLVTEIVIEAGVGTQTSLSLAAMPAREPFRPARKTPRPRVEGVQSATVVGPAGREIHTDEYGRVRVAFPWDRDAIGDDTSSCWLRVSQGWAGTGYGLLALPRVGQEVLVAFLDGNPDCPVVVGRVFNAVETTPYALPEHASKTVWRSQTTPGGDGYNEIMFEDAAGASLVYLRAQRDHVREVLNDESITVGHNRDKVVEAHETETVGGDRKETIRGNRTVAIAGEARVTIDKDARHTVAGASRSNIGGDAVLVIAGERDASVDGDERTWSQGSRHDRVGAELRQAIGGKASLDVGEAFHTKVGRVYALSAGDEVHIVAGSACVIECPDITLKGAGGFVRIDQTGVYIKGAKVFINSGGEAGTATEAAPDAPDEARGGEEA
jgi:type VI secretion system secreted protein VgrG